jgi:hypothetical protein
MKFRQRNQYDIYPRLNVFGLAIAATVFYNAALAAPEEKRVGNVDPLPSSFAEQVTKSWNPQHFPGKGHLLYAAAATLPIFALPSLKAKGSMLVERSLNATQPSFKTFRLRLGPPVYDIQASPDGKTILLKAGQLFDPQDSYSVLQWNRQKEEKVAIEFPVNSNYPRIFWSPNSRYLAFYDHQGYHPTTGVTQALTIYDITADRSMPVKVPYVETDVAWSARNTLLFIAPKPEQPGQKTENKLGPRGDLHELQPATGAKSQLVVENADGPIAESPDGRWLAFQGWPHPADSKEKLVIPNFDTTAPSEGTEAKIGKGSGIYLFDRQNKKRYCIANMNEFGSSGSVLRFTYLRWSPDGRKLIGTIESAFCDIDLMAHNVRGVAAVANDEKPDLAEPRTQQDFDILAFSPDNSVLLVKKAQWKNYIDVQTIDMKTGAVATVTRIENARGVTWVDDNSANNKALVKPK